MELKDIVTLNESEKEFLKKLHDTSGGEEWNSEIQTLGIYGDGNLCMFLVKKQTLIRCVGLTWRKAGRIAR